MRTCTIVGCTDPAKWEVISAYLVAREAIHPLVAHYPAGQERTCSAHVAVAMDRDEDTPGATSCWVVKSLRGET